MDISDIQVYDLQPFSVEFRWSSAVNYHLYQVDVYDITTATTEEEPGEHLLSHYVEPSRLSPIAPKYALVTGLEADRYYRLLVRPGNHTLIHEEGEELVIKTPPYHTPYNLIINGDFAGNDEYWERPLSVHAPLLPLRPPDAPFTKDSIPSRPKPYYPADDYAMAIYIRAGPDVPISFGILQSIPAEELPKDCLSTPCQISVSAWSRVDKLFGPPAHLSLQLKLRYLWMDGSIDEFMADWDPYEEQKWQPMAFSTGLVMGASKARLDKLEVWGALRAPKGIVFFDDFYLSARPIMGDGVL